jgi:hypothetical protein
MMVAGLGSATVPALLPEAATTALPGEIELARLPMTMGPAPMTITVDVAPRICFNLSHAVNQNAMLLCLARNAMAISVPALVRSTGSARNAMAISGAL